MFPTSTERTASRVGDDAREQNLSRTFIAQQAAPVPLAVALPLAVAGPVDAAGVEHTFVAELTLPAVVTPVRDTDA